MCRGPLKRKPGVQNNSIDRHDDGPLATPKPGILQDLDNGLFADVGPGLAGEQFLHPFGIRGRAGRHIRQGLEGAAFSHLNRLPLSNAT